MSKHIIHKRAAVAAGGRCVVQVVKYTATAVSVKQLVFL